MITEPKFLCSPDYDPLIREDILNVILKQRPRALTQAMLAAMEEMQSYLSSRYDLKKVFAPLVPWQKTKNYVKDMRILFYAEAYNKTAGYQADDLVSFVMPGTNNEDKIYRATEDITPGIAPGAAGNKWEELAWNNSAYAVKAGSAAAGTLPTDQDKFAPDTRNALIVTYLVDMTLYHVHSAINPQKIPDLRGIRYEAAITWLKAVSKGSLNPDLPILIDESGGTPSHSGRIAYGSNPKRAHRF